MTERHDQPALTVAIATYNRAGYLREAIDSVLGQSFSDFVLRITDDASTDDTREVVAAIDDPRVSFVRQPANVGWLANCNRALEGVTTEFVTLLGDDDQMLPGALEAAMAILEARHDVGFVHAGLNLIDGDGRVLMPRWNFTRDLTADGEESGQQFIRKAMALGNRVCSQTVVMRTHALPAVPFDARDGPVADFGLWIRLALDWDVWFRADPAVNYRVHAGSDSALWSTVRRGNYRPSSALILRLRSAKLRFLRSHRSGVAAPRYLRLIVEVATGWGFVSRLVGTRVTDWLKRRARWLVRLAAGSRASR